MESTFDVAGSLSVRCVEPAFDPAWTGLLASSAAGLFHSPPWLRALADTYGLSIRAWIATDGAETPVGGVAFCELDDLVGHRVVCLPFSDCADPLFASPAVWQALLARLQSAGAPVQLRCLFEDRVQPVEGLAITNRAPWHRISVTDPEDELWRRIAPAARRSIRRAERAGVEIRALHGDADREAFHRLHVALRKRKYRLLAQPPSFLDALEHRFEVGRGWHALAAELDGRMIAGTVYLRWRDVLYYKFNASETDALAARPNHLLVWEGMRLAKRLGCTALDLGPSRSEQPGLVRFKRSFGADELGLRFLSWTPPDWRQATPPVLRALADYVRVLTSPDLPDEVTARAGAALYRYLA
jgi:CelD/BcsL family acetyltransferase involved in cellulose biosynthesis